jgi:hypothetical protein
MNEYTVNMFKDIYNELYEIVCVNPLWNVKHSKFIWFA